MSEFSRETLASTPCIRPLHAGQDDQACRALHPGADCRALAGGRLPSGPTLFVWRALRDGLQSTSCSACGHIGRFLVTEAGVLCTPERGQQLGAQASTWQHIQGGIDALVRESRPYVVRLRVSETPGNLFGRTSLVQVGADIGPEPRVQELARPSWLTSPSRCQTLQCRPATESRVRCACIRGSRCCARAATNTLAVTCNGRPWARPKLRVSRSSALMCA